MPIDPSVRRAAELKRRSSTLEASLSDSGVPLASVGEGFGRLDRPSDPSVDQDPGADPRVLEPVSEPVVGLSPRVVASAGAILANRDAILAEHKRRQAYRAATLYPDAGPLRRALYVDHLAFFKAGFTYTERVFLAANRIGKTLAAAYEVRCHLTGLYPPWWEGHRFLEPQKWWFAGATMESTRDVMQVELLGHHDNVPARAWSGMIDPHLITHTTRKAGAVANCIGSIYVQHVSGGISSADFKSYDQGRQKFQGTAVNVWLDEEPPSAAESKDDIYTELLMRTMTINGRLILTYTPLEGLTPFISRYVDTSVMWNHDAQTFLASRDVLFPTKG